MIALQHTVIRSRTSALLAAMTQLQLSNRHKRLLYVYFSQRERELQKTSPQQTIQWYEKATAQLTTSKDKLRPKLYQQGSS